MVGCHFDSKEPAASGPVSEQAPTAVGSGWFRDEATARGLAFVHYDGRSGARYYVETAASGGGFWDFDNDGDLDVYLINGAMTPGSPPVATPRNALYENRNGLFFDVTESSGLGDSGYGMGMCLGDVDGDGLTVIFLTNFGPDKLYRNRGDGTFEDWTDQGGLGGLGWGTGCAFGDVDGDGDLDLYVANYVAFGFEDNPVCRDEVRGISSYCRPSAFKGQRDFLYINQGNGVFFEEGLARGIASGDQEKGFGVLFSDIDWDGDLDLMVANDGTMNRFYENRGDGFFIDKSLGSGLGFNGSGLAESGMGLDLGDVDGDGRFDLIVTNYSFESNTLYLQKAGGVWDDVTLINGLAGPTYQAVGWGVAFLDAENDGDLDVAFANGHVMDNIELFEPNLSYAQANLFMTNEGQGHFRDQTAQFAPQFLEKAVSRALALGDVNQDGRIDVLVTNNNSSPNLFINYCDLLGNWLEIRLAGSKMNPDAIGAKLRLFSDSDRLLGIREVRSGGSFLSQNTFVQHFGLGVLNGPFTLEIFWPNGLTQRVQILSPNSFHTLVQPVAP